MSRDDIVVLLASLGALIGYLVGVGFAFPAGRKVGYKAGRADADLEWAKHYNDEDEGSVDSQ